MDTRKPHPNGEIHETPPPVYVVVHASCPCAIVLSPNFMPKTDARWGGDPDGPTHLLYRLSEPLAETTLIDPCPSGNEMPEILSLRVTNDPRSCIDRPDEIVEQLVQACNTRSDAITASALQRGVHLLAIVCLFMRHYDFDFGSARSMKGRRAESFAALEIALRSVRVGRSIIRLILAYHVHPKSP